jgi:hypothetical protein
MKISSHTEYLAAELQQNTAIYSNNKNIALTKYQKQLLSPKLNFGNPYMPRLYKRHKQK